MSGTNQPCGCHDQASIDPGFDTSIAAIPPLAEFERQLDALTSFAGEADLNELDLASLDASLEGLEQLSLDDGDDVPALGDLLRLLERFPGLKLSLSFSGNG